MSRRRLQRPERRVDRIAGGFVPTAIAGCVLWLRADLGITLNAGNVSAWADQSGQARHVTQGTAANQPLYVASDAGYAGRPVVQFDGINDRLQSGAFALAQPYTIVIVGNDDGVSGNEYFCDGGLGGNESVVRQTAGKYGLYAGAALDSTVVDSGAKNIIAGEFNGATSKTYVSSKTASATGDAGASAMSGFTVGSFGTVAGTLLTGKIAEIIVYSGALSAGNRGLLFDYLGARYTITVTP